MKINKEAIKIEMTTQEYNETVFCLKQNVENCHIRLLAAERGDAGERIIKSMTHTFSIAVQCYENVSGKVYHVLAKQQEFEEKIPSLRRF